MKNRVIQILQISEDQYNNQLLDNGMLYCEHYTVVDALGCNKLKTSAHFWTWWTNQYRNIDNEFIKQYSYTDYSLDYLRSKYNRMHHPKFMQVYPSDYVIKSAFGGILNGKKVTYAN